MTFSEAVTEIIREFVEAKVPWIEKGAVEAAIPDMVAALKAGLVRRGFPTEKVVK